MYYGAVLVVQLNITLIYFKLLVHLKKQKHEGQNVSKPFITPCFTNKESSLQIRYMI